MRRSCLILQHRHFLKPSVLAAVGDLLVKGPRLLVPSTSSLGPEVDQPLTSEHIQVLRSTHRLSAFCKREYASQESLSCRSLHTSARLSATVNVLLAQTGEGIKECELIQWFVKEGDTVAEFDQLCEVQSDKAAVEITSQYAGIIRQLHHTPGSMVQVGEALLSIDMEDDDSEAEAVSISSQDSASQASPTSSGMPAADAPLLTDTQATLASPAVRRVAREHGINLTSVRGSGPDGRISKGDVMQLVQSQRGPSDPRSAPSESILGRGMEAAIQILTPAAAASSTGQDSSTAQTTQAQPQEPVVIPLRGYRRAMVNSMTAAGAVPHFHYCDEISVGPLLRLRAALVNDPSLQGLKLTFLPFMLKAVSVALRQWPDVNGSLSTDGSALLRHPSHNLGVAMATPSGLVVPNIKGVENRSIVSIAEELARLQVLAQAGKLGQEDLSGGTLTVSNIGAIGGTYATPLVNVPEVAIVALGKVREVAQVGKDGRLEMVPRLAASWGADHRVIDGATLALFSNSWKAYVEEPERLLLHLS
ncbi:Lipoamide acyltransferase component of branched-chain alpha-keto acid dehydrogenase complex [Coccomyxa sp. Obi]|nr:Lipoamide acyltransferase component of branched-chain alpha-keto acid dehydrogenase complex [Coccomyxa sp. Obi]